MFLQSIERGESLPFTGLEIGLLLAGIGGGAASAIGSAQGQKAASKESAEASLEIAKLNDERERALAAGDDARARELAAMSDKLARDLAKQDDTRSRDIATGNLALEESALDPFRHQMNQAGALGKLDMMELGNLGPATFNVPSEMQQYVPQMSGGFSYEQSPELRASAGALKRDVMGGNSAPTMTDPRNYGKTGAIDVLSVLSGGPARAIPSAMSASEDVLSFDRPVKREVNAVDPFEPSYDPLLDVEDPGVQGARGVMLQSRRNKRFA